MVAGSALTGTGLAWLTLLRTDSSYLSGVLGPMLLFGFGMGLNFVTLTLTAASPARSSPPSRWRGSPWPPPCW